MKHATFALALLLLFCALLPVAYAQEDAPRTFYLTIDDSPSNKTEALLDLLKEENIPATFFVIGRYAKYREQHWPQVRRIVEEGHTLACHSFNHNRESLAGNTTKFEREIGNFNKSLSDILGYDYVADVFRFPYGSNNSFYTRDIKRKATAMGMLWLDWNATNGDGNMSFKSDQEMLDYAIKTMPKTGDVVMLVHDHSERTVRVLPQLIAYLREQGFVFEKITATTDLSGCESLLKGPIPGSEDTSDDESAA